MTKLIIGLLWNVTYSAKLEHFCILVLLGWLFGKSGKRAIQPFDLDFVSAVLSQSCLLFSVSSMDSFYCIFILLVFLELRWTAASAFPPVMKQPQRSSVQFAYLLSHCAWMCLCAHLQSQFSCQVSKGTWVSCKSTGKMLEPQELGMGPTCACCFTLQGLVYILACVMLTLCVWEISHTNICLSNF